MNEDQASLWVVLRRYIGLGIVIRDSFGRVKTVASFKEKAMISPLISEVMAMWRDIVLALDSGLIPFQIDFDSLQVVELVNKGQICKDESVDISVPKDMQGQRIM
ncbi:hypothetical protein QYF36_020258 [Acer negundo]|nr:hypothetical protein QYF36_020258 [Acer negundo]